MEIFDILIIFIAINMIPENTKSFTIEYSPNRKYYYTKQEDSSWKGEEISSGKDSSVKFIAYYYIDGIKVIAKEHYYIADFEILKEKQENEKEYDLSSLLGIKEYKEIKLRDLKQINIGKEKIKIEHKESSIVLDMGRGETVKILWSKNEPPQRAEE